MIRPTQATIYESLAHRLAIIPGARAPRRRHLGFDSQPWPADPSTVLPAILVKPTLAAHRGITATAAQASSGYTANGTRSGSRETLSMLVAPAFHSRPAPMPARRRAAPY